MSRQSRALGALLGVHSGDSLGATLEFESHAWILKNYPEGIRDIIGGGTFRWPAGHATDDTDMTRAILLAHRDLHRSRTAAEKQEEQDIVKLAADHFVVWFNGHPWPGRRPNSHPRDIGGATCRGLEKYIRTGDPFTSGAGRGSAGNGSLMRCIPTALFSPDQETLVRDSMAISAVTHDDERCPIACAVYNLIVANLVAGKTAKEAVKAGEDLATDFVTRSTSSQDPSPAQQVLSALQRGQTLSVAHTAATGPPDDIEGHFSGYVLDSLTLAIAAVLDERSLEDVLVDVVRCGMDTDTNGAIAGGLLGARDGVEGIPSRWREKLQFGKEFEQIVTEMGAVQGWIE